MQLRMHRSALYLLAALIFLTLVPLRSAVGQDLLDGVDPASPAAVDAALAASFNYQGQLKRSGSPYTGACSMQFSLWNAATAGTQVGATLSFATVNVSTGAFNVALNFGGGAFPGDARWLATAVKCSTDIAFVTLTPRQAIAATPYAISLRPGAVISDTVTGDSLRVQKNAVNSNAIHGKATAAGSIGVWGEGVNNTGVYGLSGGGIGVWGKSTSGYGVYGEGNTGVSGRSTNFYGVEGRSASSVGVLGYSDSNYGIYGSGGTVGVFGTVGGSTWGRAAIKGADYSADQASGYAGYFAGRVAVNGTLLPYVAATRMDHPLDPANKTLSHAFMESPDMLNVYNGNVTTDANGDATVTLPDYYTAINQDPRYQLTVIGQFAQAIVAEEIANNQFKIKTDKPNVKVSWQVTGIRKDPYAVAHRIVAEEAKLPEERGRYFYPEGYGQPQSMSIDTLSVPNATELETVLPSGVPALRTKVQP